MLDAKSQRQLQPSLALHVFLFDHFDFPVFPYRADVAKLLPQVHSQQTRIEQAHSQNIDL